MVNSLKLNKILTGIIFYFLKKTIIKNTSYDVIGNNNPINKVNLLNVPCFLMIGDKDDLVNIDDFKEMFNNL